MLLLIIILILLGALLLVAELVLLPGLSVAGFLALSSYGGATYIAFDKFGSTAGIVVLVVIAIISSVVTIISLKSKTWSKLALKAEIKSSSQEIPQQKGVNIGDSGVTITRLAPIGKVKINDEIYEAKSYDVFIDQSKEITVVGFENFNVIVKKQTK